MWDRQTSASPGLWRPEVSQIEAGLRLEILASEARLKTGDFPALSSVSGPSLFASADQNLEEANSS
jgi:hypothetical protein